MFKLKYQAHKIINYVFYLIVFVIGFLLGFGAKKIDFNNLISDFLFIENVQAYTLFERTTGSYPITIDENYLMEKITLIDKNFDLKTHSNVICVTNSNSNSMWTSSEFSYKPDGTHGAVSGSSGYKIDCYFISTDTINQITSISYSGNSSANHNFSPTITGDIKKLSIMLGTNSSSLSSTGYMLYQTLSSLDKINTYSTGGSLGVYLYTNFDYSYSLIKNTLDFSKYLEEEENIFLNNGSIFDNDENKNFNKYCWNFENSTIFTLTPNEDTFNSINLTDYNGEYTFFTGFYAFGNIGNFQDYSNMERGYLYNSKVANTHSAIDSYRGILFENLQNITSDFSYLNSNDILTSRYYNTIDPLGDIDTKNLNSYYLNNLSQLKYSHYFRSEYYFNSLNDVGYHIFKYSPICEDYTFAGVATQKKVCHFQSGDVEYEDISSKVEGNVCIYVPNNYNVSVLTQNSQGGITGSITNPNGDNLDLNSSVSEYDEYGDYYDYFFDSLPFEDYGLSSIVFAPLNALDKMVTGTCEPINLNILNSDISLPCGNDIFWDREDVKPFKTFWNMFLGGIICYGIGISIYRTVKDIKDPNSDKLEVIDL